MASAQATAINEQLKAFRDAALGAETTPTLEEMRAASEALGGFATEPEGVSYEIVDLGGGIRGQWIVPDGAPSDAVLQYVHGGGYVICSIESHRRLVGHIARAAGIRALSVDYRLAPESPHPGPVNDSVAAYEWLLAQGFAPSKLAIAGDSAGGGLTIATLLLLRDRGIALPACAVPISPWTDLEGTGGTMTTNADKDFMVGAEGLKGMADMFLGGGDAHDPYAAPLHASLIGLPPMLVQVGGDETLLDDSLRLAENARRDGVELTLEVVPEMQHVFQMAAGNMPEADEAIARIGAYVRSRLSL